jgi:hypothetical protein
MQCPANNAGIIINMLPPLGLISPFRPANSDVLNLYIAGLSRKSISITKEEKIQDISGK